MSLRLGIVVSRKLATVCLAVLPAGCGCAGLAGDGLSIRPSDQMVTGQRAV